MVCFSRSVLLWVSNWNFEIYWHDFVLYSGHCKKLAPEYSAAAEILAKNDPPYYLGKVDATEEKKLAERFGVQGFPTLYFFK